MKTLSLLLITASLTGCAYYEGQAKMNDPDCKFSGKPNNYTLPAKCCPCGYGGNSVTAIRTMPNTYILYKN